MNGSSTPASMAPGGMPPQQDRRRRVRRHEQRQIAAPQVHPGEREDQQTLRWACTGDGEPQREEHPHPAEAGGEKSENRGDETRRSSAAEPSRDVADVYPGQRQCQRVNRQGKRGGV